MTCPYCDCDSVIGLGALGNREHYRCRGCGGEFHFIRWRGVRERRRDPNAGVVRGVEPPLDERRDPWRGARG